MSLHTKASEALNSCVQEYNLPIVIREWNKEATETSEAEVSGEDFVKIPEDVAEPPAFLVSLDGQRFAGFETEEVLELDRRELAKEILTRIHALNE
ncbi:hypothetical protein [Galenea microaerophila]